MGHRRRRGIAGALASVMVAAGLALAAAPASAEIDPGVTLEAGRSVIPLGDKVGLQGTIDPATKDETIVIRDEDGKEHAQATTDEAGRFKVTLQPRRSNVYRAWWHAVPSEPVEVKVRPKVNVTLTGVRLFGKARVAGRVAPAFEGRKARVTLYRGKKALWTRRLLLADGKRFSTGFRVRKPGAYRAVARVKEPAGSTGRAGTGRVSPPLPSLSPGARNIYVKLLKGRLRGLKYHVDGVNRHYTRRTADAVMAFNKIQRRTRRGTVDSNTWRALARAGRPKARFSRRGLHVEIDQTRQVVMTVKGGKVTRVLHTSTGRNGYTRNGTFRVYRKLAGYSPNRLYYPAYFDGLRAFHGWPEVPTYPASSGCARLPMWTAQWIFNQVRVGTVVRVYH